MMAICEDDVDIDRDRDLVCRFQAGDIEAFDALYTRYFARLTRFCAKRLEDPSDAEELAQEAFARAFRALPRLKGEQRFYPWLTVIASRVCVDQYRTRCRAAKVPKFEDRGVDGGQDAVFDEVDRAHVTLAMQQLRPRHRDVLHLREEMGWTYLSIAQHYDVSVGTVQLLIFRARHALRREFHAIAGDRASVAFPLLALAGGALRAMARRLRRVAQLVEGAPAFLQPVAALALVVGATVLVLGAPNTTTVPAFGASSAPTSPLVAATAAMRAHDAQRGVPGAGGQPGGASIVGLPRGAEVGSAREIEPRAQRSEVQVSAAGYSAGANPSVIRDDTESAVRRRLGEAGVRP